MSTLRITRRAADRLRAGHLWVYRTDLEPNQPDPEPGALVTLTDSRNIPLGTALYSTASTIAARLISRTPALSRAQYLADEGAGDQVTGRVKNAAGAVAQAAGETHHDLNR